MLGACNFGHLDALVGLAVAGPARLSILDVLGFIGLTGVVMVKRCKMVPRRFESAAL